MSSSYSVANRELRIERTANGKLSSCHQPFSDTGNRNFNIAVQLVTGQILKVLASALTPVQVSHCPTELRDRPMRPGSKCWNALTEEQKRHLHPFVQTS